MALCVWWPGFELQLERARAPGLRDTPLALSDTAAGTRRYVEQACPFARADGVEPGQLVSQAIALSPGLVVLEQDPDFYDAVRARVLVALRRWSPVVEPTGERGRIFVGLDGLERMYGPIERQRESIREALRELFPRGTVDDLRLGCAPGKFAARVAAGVAEPAGEVVVPGPRLVAFLARQPVEVLPVSPRMVQRLRRLGIRRLGRLVEIPEPALVAQFGADGRRALAWAQGRRIDRVRPEAPERPIRVSLDFPSPVGQIELLHAALDRLIVRALRRSAHRGRSVRGIRVGARLEDGGSWTIRAIVKEPTGQADRLGAFLRSRIALSPPPRAVEGLKLEFFRFGSASTQTDLFSTRERMPGTSGAIQTERGDLLPPIEEAARLLRLRLGESALYRVLELQPGSRIPERRHALLALG